jgi:hypothetical protein
MNSFKVTATAIVLVLCALVGMTTLASARDLDGVERLVPVPSGGIGVEFWSDPPAGSLVSPGSEVNLYARSDADCYLTVFSVDTEGRMRLLYPQPFDDGWIAGGRTYRVPEPRSSYSLRFSGPPGMEYVYALVSLYPLRSRYPSWMALGPGAPPAPEDWSDEMDPYRSGWVVGDPFYQVRGFCENLVPYPERRDAYATAWVYFHLGRRVPYPRFLCSDCHGGGMVDPYGPACSAVRVRVGDFGFSGHLDFRLAWFPRYSYEVWTGWRPRTWRGDRWNGPDGRWVWSSADGHRVLGGHFSDARSPADHRTDPRDHGPGRNGRWGEGNGDSRGDPRGDGRGGPIAPPPRTGNDNAWGRGFEERLRRVIGERGNQRDPEGKPIPAKPREPEVRSADRRSGVPPSKPPAQPGRGDSGREPRRTKESSPRSPERPTRDGQGRSR